jgi:hypothetical protein
MSKLIVNEIEKYDAGQLAITTGTNVSIGSDLTVSGSIVGTLSTAAQTNITSVGTLSSLSVSGDLTVDTTTLYVDSANNRVAVGTTNAQQKLHIQDAGAVSIRLNDSTTNYWDLTNNSNLIFSRGGTERMRIDSSGNVGIGTSSPAYKLAVERSESFLFYGETDATSGSVFRLRSNGGATNILEVQADGNVGIGTGTPTERLQVESNINARHALRIHNANSGASATSELVIDSTGNNFYIKTYPDADTSNANRTDIGTTAGGGYLTFTTGVSERMRIDSSGRVSIAKTSATESFEVNGSINSTFQSNSFNTGAKRTFMDCYAEGNVSRIGAMSGASTDGMDLALYSSPSGSTGTAERMRITSDGTINLAQISQRVVNLSDVAMAVGSNATGAQIRFQPQTDNAVDLGSSGVRWDDVYATNGSIITSDANEKQQIEELDEAELRVATRIKGLVRKFKWNSAVEKKGDDARIHVGVIAQDVKAAFEAEGLEADKYSLFTSNTWWEKEVTEVDSEGVETIKIQNLEEYEEGATERTRLGVRYTELLAFVIAAL